MPKTTICLWFDRDAEEAARFYAATFPDSAVGAVTRAPGDYPSGREGDVLVVHFTVAGIPCLGLNGGPAIKHGLAFSFQIATEDQEETDRYWNAIVGHGGEASACGWCRDRWGISWADHAAGADRGPGGGRRRSQARLRGHDGHDEDRHRRHRGGATRLTAPSPSGEKVPGGRMREPSWPLGGPSSALSGTFSPRRGEKGDAPAIRTNPRRDPRLPCTHAGRSHALRSTTGGQ